MIMAKPRPPPLEAHFTPIFPLINSAPAGQDDLPKARYRMTHAHELTTTMETEVFHLRPWFEPIAPLPTLAICLQKQNVRIMVDQVGWVWCTISRDCAALRVH